MREKNNIALTIKGEFFLRYCEKIASGEWVEKDYTQAYEDSLKYFIENVLYQAGKESEYSWEDLRVIGAQVLVAAMSDYGVENNDF